MDDDTNVDAPRDPQDQQPAQSGHDKGHAAKKANGKLDDALRDTATTASSGAKADRIADLEAAVLADAEGDAEVPNLISVIIPVGKPPDFFRVHPGEGQSCVLTGLQTKDMDKTFYVVAQAMRGYLADYLRRYLIVRCIDMGDEEFLWPIALPAAGDEPNGWTQSALKAVELAKENWRKLVYVRGVDGYKIDPALGDPPQPNWSERTFADLRTLGLADFVIATTDHPQAIKLREGKRRR